MHWIRALITAFSTYSRIPAPKCAWDEGAQKYVMCFFPLVGIPVGALLWGWLILCERAGVPPLPRGAVGALIPLAVTGGIHMDGFMDTCDAMASWQSRERRLEILKDSHVGAFAVIGCVSYLLLMCAAVSVIGADRAPLTVACFVLSRALSALTGVTFKNARPNGMLAAFTKERGNRTVIAFSTVYIVLCAVAMLLCDVRTGAACLIAAALCLLWCRIRAYRYFGGMTGDIAGWFLSVTELVLLAVIAVTGVL